MFEPTESLTRAHSALQACRFDDAHLAFARALEHAPDSVDALRGLGYSLFQLRRLSEALEALERALRTDPSDLLSRLLMGRLCLRLQQPAMAESHFREILSRIPDSEAARSGLIDVHVALGQLAAARTLSEEILRTNPKSEVGHLAAARLAGYERDDVRALEHFETLVLRQPGNPAHVYNRGLCLLRLGRLAQGWRDYESRFAAGAVNLPLPPTPRWEGGPVKRLLVVAEQGLGDTVLFSRFLSEASRRVEDLVLACPDSLVGLLGRSLGVACVPARPPTWPEHDAHVPLMSLPHVLQLQEAALSARPAHLVADPQRKARWQAALGGADRARLRIGIVHATSAAHSTEENPFTRRSCRARDLQPIVQRAGVQAYNLNLGKPAEDARSELAGLRELPGPIQDFEDTAAVVSLLDAVVSVDTACAHVAGAVGTSLFLLLPPAPDWKWQPHAPRAPWYETAHLVRRSKRGQWADAAAQALKHLELALGTAGNR
jgi:tetratricopeptide (TPR) repeat protein